MAHQGTELLAPAGDWEALRAAVANGADAVYFGLSNFNARHRAENFTADRLGEVIDYLHAHNVRGYVALNTLIFPDELEAAVRLAAAINDSGADAAIVQDLGLARLLREVAPDLPLHASTQMTLTHPAAIGWVKQLGISRVILARELSIAEIARLTAATDVPVEVFVHGALCVAYSGQCLTSESIGGRSANRGQCAQACRLPYDLIVDSRPLELDGRQYLLSPQDLAAHDRLGDLLNAGVRCFKIEGRLKSAHYVAAATRTYRAALDAARDQHPFVPTPQQRDDLAQSFSRGFAHGFLDGHDPRTLVPGQCPKNRGLHVGWVERITPRGVVVRLEPSATIKAGDGLVFDEGHPEQDEQGGRAFAVEPAARGQSLVSFGRGAVNLGAISIGSRVWKTDDPAVRRRLEQTYNREGVARRVPVDFTVEAYAGRPPRLRVMDREGHAADIVGEAPLAEARNRPLTLEYLRGQLDRLGDTPFALGEVKLNSDGRAMAPASVINDLRRQAVAELIRQRSPQRRPAGSWAPALHSRERGRPRPQFSFWVLARTHEQLEAAVACSVAGVYCDFEDVRRYPAAVQLARAAGIPVGIATLRILKPGEEGLLWRCLDAAPDLLLVRNLASLELLRRRGESPPLVGDYSLNVANEQTADLLLQAGLSRITAGYDLNWPQLAAMLQRTDPGRCEIVIHQHMPMFHMEHCVYCATLSDGHDHRDCGRPCETHQVELRDRVGAAHPLAADAGCRNTVYNATAQSAAEYVGRFRDLGVSHFRVELLREDASQTRELIRHYTDILAGSSDGRTTRHRLRVLGGVGITAGTLEHE